MPTDFYLDYSGIVASWQVAQQLLQIHQACSLCAVEYVDNQQRL